MELKNENCKYQIANCRTVLLILDLTIGRGASMGSTAVVSQGKPVAPRPADASPPSYRRSPAVPVTAAFAAGILVDHLFEPDLTVWLVAAGVCLAGWAIGMKLRRPRASAALLLSAVLIAGAGWHHWRWSIVGADHIVRFAEETPQPVHLVGRLVDQPWVVPRKEQELPVAIAQFDRTLATLECHTLISGHQEETVSGRVRLE